MWRTDPPNQTAADSFRVCKSHIRNKALKNRLQSVEDRIVTSDRAYVGAAKTTSLHTLDPDQFSCEPNVTDREMISLYKNNMARKQSPGRVIYDQLILAAQDGRCPLCGQRQVTTLDHHLPKSTFPSLAVNPSNLVPACSDCNKSKLDVTPTCSEEETLHPYFDNIENELWLRGKMLESRPAALIFFVDPPVTWSETLTQRVKLHFQIFGLARLYAAQAAYELSNIRFYLTQLYSANAMDGAGQVRKHLESQAESRQRAHINSWQTATYRALSESDWYCEGGFFMECTK